MNHFVEEYDEVIDNVRQFNLDLDSGTDIVTQLSQFRHWYYIPELDYFGPIKKNMTTPKYNRGKGKEEKVDGSIFYYKLYTGIVPKNRTVPFIFYSWRNIVVPEPEELEV